MLIVIEGIDGCGKETQIKLLKEKLDCVVFKYPTKHYSILNDYLEKKVYPDPKALFLLFLADIAEEQRKVKAALDEGRMVILDRYVLSTIAYEVDGIGYEDGKGIVENVGYLEPDMVLLLDIDERTSQERKKGQKELDRYEEDMAYLARVRSNFLRLHEDRFLTPNWHMIDAGRDIASVHADMMRLLE